MDAFGVDNPKRLADVLCVFAELDRIRWSDAANYNLINYWRDDLSADDKLLTHWLCYITDRQMSFLPVWEVGGYVISQLVSTYRSDGIAAVQDRHLHEYEVRGSPHLTMTATVADSNRRLELQGQVGDVAYFASRFPAGHIVLILRTLEILERVAGGSFGGFLAAVLEQIDSRADGVDALAGGLEGLTYEAGRRVPNDQFREIAKSVLANVPQEAERFCANTAEWLQDKRQRLDRKRYDRKRLWCALRDYLKSPEFNRVLVQALEASGFADANRWHRDNAELREALERLELPGDVWNNNRVFSRGLFAPYVGNEAIEQRMPQAIRGIYEDRRDLLRGQFHPEQLDVTFDFVPRMCDRQMCRVCPFGGGVSQLCHAQTGLLCPVALTTCGYEHVCEPEGCIFRSDYVAGLCEHWQALGADATP
ncbi:MAG: hypothetical protein KGY81_06385 [Phycisphaerae bacterium]|nr:hypothetical protein [Phycisphaerae bacterium]